MKHGASFDFAWFHDNNIIDYRGNNNLWTINLISERSGRREGGYSYTVHGQEPIDHDDTSNDYNHLL